jgi:hypothetical protein
VQQPFDVSTMRAEKFPFDVKKSALDTDAVPPAGGTHANDDGCGRTPRETTKQA